jgi:hypothetical protein
MEVNIKQLEARVLDLEVMVLNYIQKRKVDELKKRPALTRYEIWFEAWKTAAGKTNCTRTDARVWADACLMDYDRTFNSRTGEAKGAN